MVHWVRSIPGKLAWLAFFRVNVDVHPLLQALAKPLKSEDDITVMLDSLVELAAWRLRSTIGVVWVCPDPEENVSPAHEPQRRRMTPELGQLLEQTWRGQAACLSLSVTSPPVAKALLAAGIELIAPMIYQGERLGWLGIGQRQGTASYNEEEIIFLEILARRAAMAVRCAQLKRHLENHVAELRQAYHQNVTTQETERRQLSENLHDETLQHLADISVRLGLLRQRQRAEPDELLDLQDRLVRADQRLREIVRGLHPSVLSDLGLIEAIIAFFETVNPATLSNVVQIDLRVEGFGSQRLPDQGLELTLYRFVQNAATNALVHSLAKRIIVFFTWEDDWVEVRVEDDGCGMKTTLTEAVRSGHFGLLSMRERIMAHGGSFRLDSTAEEGTKIAGRIPLRIASPQPAHVECYTFQLA
jgi:signal transduction histidine kinase